eukprot:CAMPEP_0171090710 /NCGR_PEP_ID=MMETSP0766_2-20121228/32025_1 /TAXON_ID=439317 /ORGANISM="Gambierdiscus australes, Strain CAWD 149" /LENGTH=75 /DNA_ID=CAMNT_0011548739 /DNA_START=64 /DNA_END=291 /DNA_ORIENTATION=-
MGCCGSSTATSADAPVFHDKKMTDEEREERRRAQAAAAEQRAAANQTRGTSGTVPRAKATGGQQESSMMSPGQWN